MDEFLINELNDLYKRYAIEFAEWLWSNAIAYQCSGTYTFREVDGKVNSYTIDELYHKYLPK